MLRIWLAAGLAAAASASWAIDGVVPDAKLNPGEGMGNEVYEETVDVRNRQRKQEAGARGESHLDVVTAPAEDGDREAVTPPEPRAKAPAGTRGGTPAGERPPAPVEPVRPQAEWVPPERAAPAPDEGDGTLDSIVAALVDAINREPDIRRIGYRAPEGGGAEPGSARRPAAPSPLPRVAAGDAFYARVLHAVNSDYPGPVLIELLQPPLAGAVARGEFQLVRDRLVIRMSALEVGQETVPVDAVAVGLDCACFGVPGEVSYHWWDRVLLPAATGFVERYLIARAQPERRVVEVDGGTVVTDERARTARQARDAGLAEAVGRVGRVLLEQAPSRQTVEIPRNAEVAVMFAERLQRTARAAPAGAPEPEAPRVERVRGGPADGGEVRQ